VVLNKTDLPGSDALRRQLAAYGRIGYPVLAVSAKSGDGIPELDQALAGGTGILVGQSGVGKSSLINALCPGADVATAELSLAADEGRHTTTASMLHHLPGGGALIDSPGVRDYAPGLVPREAVQVGFREIRDASEGCRFGNCMHLVEPGCAVRSSVEDSAIEPRRYESYRRLLRLVENLGKPAWS
jgi:ribosome biogenesis GTPase